jgi:hypothetical protein
VADFDLPERSLVVIELDENSLGSHFIILGTSIHFLHFFSAHQPLIWRLLNSSLPGIQCPSSLANQSKFILFHSLLDFMVFKYKIGLVLLDFPPNPFYFLA